MSGVPFLLRIIVMCVCVARKLPMFGLEKPCSLDKTWTYPCNPSLHLYGQIGGACGKNSCLFSETDKSIQITECKSQLYMAGKIHLALLLLTLMTPSSNEFQLSQPLLTFPLYSPPLPELLALSTSATCQNSVQMFIPRGAGREALCKRVEFVEIIINLSCFLRPSVGSLFFNYSGAKKLLARNAFAVKNMNGICLFIWTHLMVGLSALTGVCYKDKGSIAMSSLSKGAFSITY